MLLGSLARVDGSSEYADQEFGSVAPTNPFLLIITTKNISE